MLIDTIAIGVLRVLAWLALFGGILVDVLWVLGSVNAPGAGNSLFLAAGVLFGAALVWAILLAGAAATEHLATIARNTTPPED